MRIVLVGAVGSTEVALRTLTRERTPPVALVTLPQSQSQRHSDFVPLPPIAEQFNIPVIESSSINSPATLRSIRKCDPEYILVIGWSQICHEPFRSIARVGSIGFHPALLPENRGRAVIPWTILQRQRETGTTLFWLDEGVDSGDILLQKRLPVDPAETAATLCEKHETALGEMLVQMLPLLRRGDPPREAQDHAKATYCARRKAEDGWIDWHQSAADVWTLIRAVGKPYPGAFTLFNGKKMTIWDADFVGERPYWGLPGQVQAVSDRGALVQCGDRGHVLLRKVQIEDLPEVSPTGLFKPHEKLGPPPPGLLAREI